MTPVNRSAHPPILIIGMHRSGTSLLSRMLSELGLFVGMDLQADHESVYFIRLNNWLLRQAQATWDYPEKYQIMARQADWLQQQAVQVSNYLKQRSVVRYTGKSHVARFRSDGALYFPWGWKDPRNTFTLPLWLLLYPDAKVIHIKRHGVDVAQSLVARERQATRKLVTLLKAVGLQWPRTATNGFANPLRCTKLDGSFSLWEYYTKQAHEHVLALGDRATEIVYEHFLQDPVNVLEGLCRFIGLPVDKQSMGQLVDKVRPDRAFAYRSNTELQKYAVRVGARLKAFGYDI